MRVAYRKEKTHLMFISSFSNQYLFVNSPDEEAYDFVAKPSCRSELMFWFPGANKGCVSVPPPIPVSAGGCSLLVVVRFSQ